MTCFHVATTTSITSCRFQENVHRREQPAVLHTAQRWSLGLQLYPLLFSLISPAVIRGKLSKELGLNLALGRPMRKTQPSLSV